MAAPTEEVSTERKEMETSQDTGLNILNNNDSGINEDNIDDDDELKNKWGFGLKDLYKLATGFFKDQEGKAFHLSYKDRLTLIAYTQQVLHGSYNSDKSPALGYLDVIGKDRRQAWAQLGSMSTKEAMINFVKLLDSTCTLLEPFLQAHKCHLLELQRRRKEEEERLRLEEEERERLRLEEEARAKEEADRQRQTEQKRLIQEALNRQTYHQFKAYAEQQYPGNPEQQALLIRQLQQQHYQQYMQQVLQQQLLNNQAHHNNNINHKMSSNLDKETEDDEDEEEAEDEEAEEENSSGPDTSEEAETTEVPPTVAASMWTRKDVREFKDSIRKEGGDGTIKVGHGETVTVRVPTHTDGTCLFWEFATDSYDIGFGVYFEWTKNPGTQVSVHISESEDEEEEDEENEANGDVERGGPLSSITGTADKPPVSVIIPVYRRDCHEEVYAGSHVYPGQGVYLLKFDNSYSLWRSKTLYYRVYYTR